MNGRPESDLLKAPVNRALLLMASPISIGMLSTFLFQVVDTYFVGRLGSKELAALGFASAVYFLLVNLFMGLAVGVSSLVGRSLGEDNRSGASAFTVLALAVTLLLSVLLSSIGIFTIEPLFRSLGADPESLVLIDRYMSVLYLGLPILNLGIVGGSAVRATGNIKPPEIIMGLAGLINLVLDYLLIFGVGPFPRMEIAGAAWATVFSYVFIGLSLPIFLFRAKLLRAAAAFGDFARSMADLKEIARLSTPAILTQILTPLTATFLVFLVARSGPEAVAAFGIAVRIETLALVGIFAVSVAITPFVAQNFGAGLTDRIDAAIVFAGKASVYWGGLIILILVVFAKQVAEIFSSDPTIVDYSKRYFYIVALSYPSLGILTVTSALFNGIQIPRDSLKVLLVKTFAFTLPLTWLGSFWGYTGVLVGIALSNIAGGLYAGRVMNRSLAGTSSRLHERRPLDEYAADLNGLLGRFYKQQRST